MPQTPPAGSGPSLLEAMPRPLLILFVALGVISTVATVVFLIKPPAPAPQPVAERRPPPARELSHGVGRVFPAPLPSSVAPTVAPCKEVEGARGLGGPAAVARVRIMLEHVCRLARGGVGRDIAEAIRGVAGAGIRTAQFDVTGVESTVDLRARTIYLNTKFVLGKIPVEQVVPVLLHEAWHLARADGPITAAEELGARRAEAAACRELVAVGDWPRWCTDAAAIASMPRARALSALEAAGYERAPID